jgi:hypothetical protein
LRVLEEVSVMSAHRPCLLHQLNKLYFSYALFIRILSYTG